VWSRDASSIVFARNTLRGGRELVLHSLRARSDSVVLFKAAQLFPEAWSSDGRWLVFSAVEGTRNTLYVADLNGRDSVRVVSGGGLYADLSRDGRWLAYCALEEEGPRTYVVSFPDLARRSQVTTSGACAPRFSADGLRLYYVDRDDWVHRMGVLHVATRASPDATTWTGHRPLFPAYSHTFVVEEDPTRFILVEPDSSRLAREIRVVTGWHDGK